MASFKKCNLKITSNILNLDDNGRPEGDVEKDEFTTEGLIKSENGELVISYREAREGGNVSCEIVARGETLSVRRRGSVVCDMLFSVGKKHKSLYSAPPFSFDMEIDTLKIENTVKDKEGYLSLFYVMTIGGASKRCRMKISLMQ